MLLCIWVSWHFPAQAYLFFSFLVLRMEMLKKTYNCAQPLLRGFALGPNEGGGEVAGYLVPFRHPGCRARSRPSLGLLLHPHDRHRRVGWRGWHVLPNSISIAGLQQFLQQPVVSPLPLKLPVWQRWWWWREKRRISGWRCPRLSGQGGTGRNRVPGVSQCGWIQR